MNRSRLTEVLGATPEQSARQRESCGLLLVTIDHLSRLNEAYGFEVADEVIGAVAKRLRAKMHGGDHLGRFSGNKFAVILNGWAPEDMEKAAERLLAGVRDDAVRTRVGPVAVTVTIGGITASRHGRDVQEILDRAHETLTHVKAKRPGSFQAVDLVFRASQRRKGALRTRLAGMRERHLSLSLS